jgi:hypothetical protein
MRGEKGMGMVWAVGGGRWAVGGVGRGQTTLTRDAAGGGKPSRSLFCVCSCSARGVVFSRHHCVWSVELRP